MPEIVDLSLPIVFVRRNVLFLHVHMEAYGYPVAEAGKQVLLIERGGPSTWNTGGKLEVPPWLTGSPVRDFT